jgi:AcrR family transcriptional regulator
VTVGKIRAAHLGPERRRPQVLDNALALATEHGLSGVTMSAVAKRMGVTKPVVYACFGRREALLEALLEREEQRLLDGVLAALPTRLSLEDPERLMIEGFQVLLTVVADAVESWQIVFASEPDPLVAERCSQARAQVVKVLSELTLPALRAWGVVDADRKLPVLADLFMAAGESAVRSLLSGGWTPAELGELFGRSLCAALRNA